jgi:hypothetical protein
MIFTDNDLKRLKDELDAVRPRRIAIQFEALLARLEAAEKCINGSKGYVLDLGDIQAWKKTKEL